MGTKKQFINTAISFCGDNYRQFCGEFGINYPTPWCAAFASTVLRLADITPRAYSMSCNEMIRQWKNHGLYHSENKGLTAGDVIYYSWVGNKNDADHVGIVTEVRADGTVVVIEGNKGDLPSEQTKVETRIIRQGYSCVIGYARPVFSDDETEYKKPAETKKEDTCMIELRTLRNGDTGKHVKTLQYLLIHAGYDVGKCGADGEIGPDTIKALKHFQEDNRLEVDGICGPITWAALHE